MNHFSENYLTRSYHPVRSVQNQTAKNTVQLMDNRPVSALQQKLIKASAIQLKGKVTRNSNMRVEKKTDILGTEVLVQKRENIPAQTGTDSYTAVIQRVITTNKTKLPPNSRAEILKDIKKLNVYDQEHRNTKEALHTQFEMIHNIETRIKQILLQNNAISDTERSELFSILHQTEAAHIHLSGRLADHHHDMWLGDTNLGPKKQKQVQTLWHSLRTSSGNMKVEGKKKFKNQVMSGYIHMLRGSHGRGMLEELNKDQPSANNHIIISNNHKANYNQAGQGKNHKKGSWAAPIGKVRNDNTHHEDGTGTGSFVQIHNTSLSDSWGGYKSGQNNQPIFAPKFITLAHELGHARHNLKGKTKEPSWFDIHPKHSLANRPDEQGKWSNPEEYENIRHEENPVRAEHNLPKRKYHATIDSARSTGNRINMDNQLQRLFRTVPDYLQDSIGLNYFGPLNERLAQTNLSNIPLAAQLQTDINTLENNLPGIIRIEKVKYYASYLKPTRKKALIGGSILAAGATAAFGLWHRSQQNQDH